MSLTFYWRCEGTTLDETHDFSAGDATAGDLGFPASIDNAAAIVGSNGILCDGQFDTFIFDSTDLFPDPSRGAIGFWVRWPTTVAPSNAARPFVARGPDSANDTIYVRTLSTGLRLFISSAANGSVTLDVSETLSAGEAYFVVARWDAAETYRELTIYDDELNVVGTAVDDSTDFSDNVPASLEHSTGLRLGDSEGFSQTYPMHIDNVFIADAYDEPIEENALITSFTEYGGSGGASVGEGTLSAGDSTVAGTGERSVTGTGALLVQSSAVSGSGALQLKLVLTQATNRNLVDESGAPVANLADIAYEWYDALDDTDGNPTQQGTFSTNENGEATIQLPNSALTSGQSGTLILYHPTDSEIRGVYRIPVT